MIDWEGAFIRGHPRYPMSKVIKDPTSVITQVRGKSVELELDAPYLYDSLPSLPVRSKALSKHIRTRDTVVSGSIPRASVDIITGASEGESSQLLAIDAACPIVIHVSNTKSSPRSKNILERQTFHHLRRPCPIILTIRNSDATISHYHLKLHHHSGEEDVARAGR